MAVMSDALGRLWAARGDSWRFFLGIFSLLGSACQPAAQASPPPAPPPPIAAPARSLTRPESAVPSDYRFRLGGEPARAEQFMVVSDSPLATRVGVDVLTAGGNASDAAVAVAFALAVVYPEAGNLGGGGFAVVHARDGVNAALDFRERAPRRALADLYKGRKDASRVGPLAAGVPGSVAGLFALHQRFGSKPWRELVLPAERLAEQGFAQEADTARTLALARGKLERFPASKALFFPNGALPSAGEIVKNPELGAVLRRIAEQGPSGFYEGETARLIAGEMERAGGILGLEDLEAYTPRWREPIQFGYRGRSVISMPPPSSGGVALALIANVLQHYPLAEPGFHSVEHVHVLAEAMRRAFADRNGLLGDPDFVAIPLAELLSDAYAAKRRATIGERATPSAEIAPGIARPEGTHTTHFAVVDGFGAAVALTTTLNDAYGSGVTVRGAGFLLNDEMDDFTTQPGEPNLYGLVQGELNAIAPGKRMLSSMAPTIVLDADGKVELVLGARGGPRIITSTWQVLSNVLDFGLSASDAVAFPRVHQQWLPDEVLYEERGLAPSTIQRLEGLGYALRAGSDLGNSPLIARARNGRGWTAAFDPRRGGLAAGR